MAEQTEDFSSLPLPDRFAHKVGDPTPGLPRSNWKVRKEGYEDARKQFEKSPDESDPVFRPFLMDPGLWKGAVADSNVAAQQEGLATYCAFLKYAGVQASSRTRSITTVPIVEKGLCSTRPAAKTNALEALLLFIELEKADPIIEDVVGTLSHKLPKVIAAALAALTAIYHNYGCKVVDSKPVLKALPKAFSHADKNVRAEAQNLTVELYRWLKEALKPLFWGELKPVQQQDLEKLFEKVKQEPAPKQERFTRAQQEAMAAADGQPDDGADGAGADGEDDAAEEDLDVFDLAEPVDVMAKVPASFNESVASSKWKDRKEALDALYAAANVPRIKEAQFDDIMRVLAKCMKDANIMVVTVAANTVDVFAKGLRKGFGKYRPVIMSPMMERLKEKKQTVADALGQALDSVFASTNLSDCLEDIFEFLKHKNPQVKQETLKFLIRCLRTTRDVPSKPETKSIAEAATKLLTESSEVTRSGGAEILGTLMKIMDPSLSSVLQRPHLVLQNARLPRSQQSLKKPAPISTEPPAEDPPVLSSPARTKPAAKGPPSKLGGISKSSGLATPGSGLKLQRKLPGPGGAVPQLSSPRRRTASPPPEEPALAAAPAPVQPKFGLGRGLAGRPIAKPSAPSAEHAPVPASAPSHVASGLSVVERAELEELRLEKERLTKLTEDLRSERAKLNSEINELQNQNAQLIEDHTRDVLSIKAKETQLVRAKSDAETAEQTVQKQQREIERLKRELTRAMRANAASPPNPYVDQLGLNMGVNEASAGIYQDDNLRASLHMGSRFESARPRSYVSSSPSEEKENNGLASPGLSSRFASQRKFSPPVGSAYSSGRGSPARTSTRTGGMGADGITSQGEPAENWRRAAEVTSQLKARIEQMKAKQGLSRPPPSH
ncbi:spindle pole body component alp14 [Coccidioides immitis H538.4]|uniref:Spindle pole body component alp14 n=1 Tax=Coccidioides immitis H538.4 TaxID=396776 RepID=A0A0J8RSY8_COCIT|nr:spindle pole body component alp14 [Coccidioides immitis H538.4]